MTTHPTLLLLGEPRLHRTAGSGERIADVLTGSTSVALLALLALEPARVLTLDRLLEEVWPDSATESGRGKLHVQVSRLRQRLNGTGLRIASRHGGYVLEGERSDIDIHCFDALAGRSQQEAAGAEWNEVLSSTSAAAQLWRGEPFPGLTAPGLDLERSRLTERWRVVRQLRCRACLELDLVDEALAIAMDLRNDDPYGEFAVWAAMTALTRQRRRADALAVFDEHRRALAEDLGLDPGQQLLDLQGAVLRDDGALTAARTYGSTTPSSMPSAAAAPTPGSPSRALLAREAELVAVDAMLQGLVDGRSSVLLVEGEAGIGRSTMVRHAAADAERRGLRVVRARGLDLVPTATLSVWRHITSRLGVPADRLDFEGDVTSATLAELVSEVISAVRDRPTFLVLDDFHRTDDASVQALQWLVGEIWDEPLAVMATRRFHGFPSSAAKELAWTALSQDPRATLLRLRPLSLTDVISYADTTEQDASVLLRRTGGNPQLLRELLSSTRASDDDGLLPCGVVSLIRARMMSLPPLARSLVAAAAITGPRFDPQELAEVLDVDLHEVVAALRHAVEAGLVAPVHGEAWWTFRHEVERDGVLHLVVAGKQLPCAWPAAAPHGSGLAAVAESLRRAAQRDGLESSAG